MDCRTRETQSAYFAAGYGVMSALRYDAAALGQVTPRQSDTLSNPAGVYIHQHFLKHHAL
jgi:hypothetical protein